MKKKNITLLVCLVASIVAAVALYLGTGGVKSDMPPSLPNIGGSQFAGSTQVIQINNTNGFHSSLIKPVCRGRYVKSLELLKSPLYVSAFGVNQASSVSDFLSKVSPDNDHYVMLLFNNITQSYVELGSNMFGSLPRIGVEEFDTYTIGSNQMVYFFTNSVNKFCFESDNRVFEPIKDVNGWSLVQLYTSQFVPNVRSAYKFNQESKPEKVTETLYKPGFYWFAFDYSDFSEDFGDEGVAVSPFGSFSDKSIYLRNDQNENVSLGVFDVLSKEMVDTLSFQVRSQTQEEFLSVVNSIELLINSESFVLAPPSTLSENSLFAIELTQAMQAALMESQQVEIILNLKAVESNQLVDLGVVFESGENKSDLLDLLNVDIYLSDLSVVMADAASDLELINGLKVSNLDYANLEFSVDGDVNVEFLTLKLSEESTVDSSNYLAIDFVVDAETIFTHRFTNDAKEISLSSAVIDQILAEGGKTLQLHTNVDLLTEQSDLELVLETKIANAEDAIEIALPQILVADYLQIEQSDYYTFSETCLLDSNIYYSATFLEELSNRFESVYDGFFGDFTTLDSLSVGLSITPYVDINDITFSYTVSGSEPVSVLQADGFTTLFEFALNDNKAPIVNFSSESYSEEFTELFNSKRLLSLDKLELSTENLALRFNLGSTNQEGDFEKIEHRCESRPDYALNVDELLFDSKIFVSDLSEFVKLNFTNLVLGKNFFVKIDWHESLMALLDLNSNPLITSLSSQDDVTMVFGFENRDLEEFDFILDQLLADLGTDDAPISEQELEDLIESNPISLTVGNANANLITEDFDLVYKNQLHTLCADRLADFTGSLEDMNMELVDVDGFINSMYYLEDPYSNEGVECENKDIYSNEFSVESENFEFFNLIVKKTANVDNFMLEFELDSEEYDFNADGANDQQANVPVNLTVRMEDLDANVIASQTCENTADLVDSGLTINQDCLTEDPRLNEVYFNEISQAFNELSDNSVFRLVIDLEYAADFVGASVELGDFMRDLVDRPVYLYTGETAENTCELYLSDTFSDLPYEFHNKKLKLTFASGGFEPSLITFLPIGEEDEGVLELSEDFSIEFDISKIFTQALLFEMGEFEKDLRLIGMEIDSNSVPLVLWGSFEDEDAMAMRVEEIQLCNVEAE